MNDTLSDTRRLLRYVLPGLFFNVELFLLFLTSHWAWFANLVQNNCMKNTRDFIASQGVGLPVIALFVSVVVGFLCSVAHHLLCRFVPNRLRLYPSVDHRSVLKDARRQGYLKLCLHGSHTAIDTKRQLTRPGAWRVLTVLWHERRVSSERIKGADGRVDNFTDLMHGTGAIFMASVFALVTWLVVNSRCGLNSKAVWISPCNIVLPAAILVALLLWISYKLLATHCQRFISMVMADEIYAQYVGRQWTSTTIFVSKKELSLGWWPFGKKS